MECVERRCTPEPLPPTATTANMEETVAPKKATMLMNLPLRCIVDVERKRESQRDIWKKDSDNDMDVTQSHKSAGTSRKVSQPASSQSVSQSVARGAWRANGLPVRGLVGLEAEELCLAPEPLPKAHQKDGQRNQYQPHGDLWGNHT